MAKQPLYSESEITEIVRRAAELQEAGSAKGYVPGITGEELARMAAEVGIEPTYLEQALSEHQSGSDLAPKRRFGIEIERVFPVDIVPENFDLITDAVRIMPLTAAHGATSGGMTQVGRSLQGQVSGGWENPHFKITSRGGRTKLNVWTSNGTAIGLSCLWIVPLCITPVVGALGNSLVGGLAAFGCAIGSFLSYKWLVKKGNATTREVAKKLETAILEAAEASDLRQRLDEATEQTEETEDPQDVKT